MLQFALVIVVYFLLLARFFERSVRPVTRKLQVDLIPFPRDLVQAWVLVAGALFPMMSIVRARESDWDPKESLGAMATFLGVALGMCVNVH